LAGKATSFLAVLAILVGCGSMALAVAPSDEEGSLGGAAGPGAMVLELFRAEESPDDGQAARERLKRRVLSNGCAYTMRGIPRCGVLVGAAYGGNTDPTAWEQSMGHPLGVRRTYWDGENANVAVDTARDDLAHQRLPWLSFKLPYSWKQMAEGRGDAWTRELAKGLATLDGPVWVAFHHEPEGDGDIREWTAMQARLAPLVRETAPNVAYSIILTGWHQLEGVEEYSLSSMWPDTKIDIAGFDVYNKFGMERNGVRVESFTDFERDYFTDFSRFAKQRGIAWGIAETGHTNRSALVEPNWTLRTYLSVLKYGGIAFTYFNSSLNSTAPWTLTGAKGEEFARLLRTTPTL